MDISKSEYKSIFITFGDGSYRWKRAAKRLSREISKLGIFDEVVCLDKKWLSEYDPKTFSLVKLLIHSYGPKGFGFWAWKASIIEWASEFFPNHIIAYMDAGFVIPQTEIAAQGIQNWVDLTIEHGGIALELPHHAEKQWTKIETLRFLEVTEDEANRNQIQGGFFFLRPDKAKEFSIQYRDAILYKDGFHISDVKSLPQIQFSLLTETINRFSVYYGNEQTSNISLTIQILKATPELP